MIEVTLTTHTEPDRRYRALVLLNRTDRPSYYKFHCPRCTRPVAELVNSEVLAISDAINFDETSMAGIGLRCDGQYETNETCTGHRFPDGAYCHGDHYKKHACRIWYYFSIGEL